MSVQMIKETRPYTPSWPCGADKFPHRPGQLSVTAGLKDAVNQTARLGGRAEVGAFNSRRQRPQHHVLIIIVADGDPASPSGKSHWWQIEPPNRAGVG
ncbi:hypothetical protein SBV1_3290008 [Verrucomicrobia bacterium]|nr:hypothetical protein SBV1_3290008 [Verrucomicrobiota bacterium]